MTETDTEPIQRAEIAHKGERGFICPGYFVTHPRTGAKLHSTDQSGKKYGPTIAKWFDDAIQGKTCSLQRCSTCAFRRGTVANGSALTISDALECLSTSEDFYCHDGGSIFDTQPQGLCAGFVAIRDSWRGEMLQMLRQSGQTNPVQSDE